MPFDRDTDYEAGFQALVLLGVEGNREGPTPALLMRKAALELQIRRFWAARASARQAQRLAPRHPEAYWLEALACLGLGLVRIGALNEGPGKPPGLQPPVTVAELLLEARLALAACLRLSGGDEEADALLGYLNTSLAAKPSGEGMDEALRGLLNR